MRIVSLVPHATELLFALGAGDEVIAVTHECDHPPEAAELEHVTRDVLPAGLGAAEIDAAVRERTEHGQAIYELDAALLTELEPDLIVSQALCPVCAVSYDDVAALAEEMRVPPRVVSLDPHTFGEALADIPRLGEVVGRSQRAAELAQQAAERIEAVQRAVEGARRPRVAALEWLDPVWIAGHWTPQLIDLAGGEDVLGHAGEPSERSDWETVAAAQPDVVLVIPCGYDCARAHAEGCAAAERLAGLGAGQLLALDASAFFSRPGPRLVAGLELLAHVLHPERISDAPAEVREIDLAAVGPAA